jgi:hypothetical protein
MIQNSTVTDISTQIGEINVCFSVRIEKRGMMMTVEQRVDIVKVT